MEKQKKRIKQVWISGERVIGKKRKKDVREELICKEVM
jgi:hypothetical protein